VTNATGFDQAGDLIQQIRQCLRKELDMEDADDQSLNAFLEHLEGSGPIFLMIPGYLDNAVLTAVRQAFPVCTFLLLAGDIDPAEESPLAYVEMLQPILETSREQHAYNLYHEARVIIKKTYVSQ
jgi:hypothetical protein